MSEAAILKIKGIPPSHPNLTAHEIAVGVAQQGDVLALAPDDWTLTDERFGNQECWRKPPIEGGGVFCLEIRGLTRRELGFLLERIPEERYRRYRLRWEDVSPTLKTELEYMGRASVTWEEIQSLVHDKSAEVVK